MAKGKDGNQQDRSQRALTGAQQQRLVHVLFFDDDDDGNFLSWRTCMPVSCVDDRRKEGKVITIMNCVISVGTGNVRYM